MYCDQGHLPEVGMNRYSIGYLQMHLQSEKEIIVVE